jgi:enediyne biosynthesis protein E4
VGNELCPAPLLYHNLKNGKFELVPAVEGTGLAVVSVGRGAAFGDIFNDGKIDVVINNMDGVPVLLRNVNPDHHHWVELRLIGGPKSPRDAVGATVYLSADGMRQRGDVLSGGSYLSSNDLRVHFGLGDATDAGTAEIHWPSGAKEIVKLPAVNRIYTWLFLRQSVETRPSCTITFPLALPLRPTWRGHCLFLFEVAGFHALKEKGRGRDCLPRPG